MPEPTPLSDLLRGIPPEWLPKTLRIADVGYGKPTTVFCHLPAPPRSDNWRDMEAAITGALITAMAKAGHYISARDAVFQIFDGANPLEAVVAAARACCQQSPD